MSTNRNRQKLNKAINYKKALINLIYPDYWDEGWGRYYKRFNRGFKNPKKQLFHFQVRQYRTWKYNRRTKWIE